jgi:PAS domain S-box-containing protein
MSLPLRVLIVEDSEDDTLLLVRELRCNGYDPVHERVDSAETMRAALERQAWDVILSDYSMPGFSAPAALTLLHDSGLDLPFIIISGTVGEETAVAALKAGAHDFLTKTHLARLAPAIEREQREAEGRRKQREAESALRRSERRFGDFMRHLPGIAFIKDERGAYLFANAAFEIELQLKPGAWLGKTDDEFLPAATASQLQKNDQTVMQTGRNLQVVETLPWLGEPHYWLITRFPIVGREGRLSMLGGVGIDVTENRRAEAALQEAEAKYRLLVEQLPAIVYGVTFGEKNWTNYISPQVASLLGFTPAEWLADPELWVRQIHPHDRERVLAQVQEADAAGLPLDVEYRVLTREGGVRWFRNQSSLVLDPQGRPRYSLGVMFDITDRKRAEEAVRRQAGRAEALARMAARLSAQLDPEAMLNTICEETAQALNVPAAVVTLYDGRGDALRYRAAFGLPPDFGQHALPISRAVFEDYSRRLGAVFVIPDVQALPDTPSHDLAVQHNLRTLCCAGLTHGGQLLGVLNALTLRTPRTFATDDLALLKALADQAAQGIVNARLFDEAQRRLEHVQALRRIDMAISASLDLRVTLNIFLDEVLQQLRVDAADVLLLNPHTQTLDYAAGRGFRTRGIEQSHLRLGEGYAGRAALERRPAQIPDLNADDPHFSRGGLLRGEGFHTYFGAPLIAKGQIKGVLEVFHRVPLEPDQEWLDYLEALAGQAAIAVDNLALFDDLQRTNIQLVIAYDATIEGWSRALDLRDKETEGHTQRVTEMTMRLARARGVADSELVHMRRGALLHDIGKMGIPDRILLKPGPLDDEEWEIMRRHPQYAYDMLLPIAYLRPALDIPYCHHEKWDGSGYPRGLKGHDIPLAARIFAVADVWDALSSDRPYRPKWPPEKVREHIRAGAGAHFDPEVAALFLSLMDED